MFKLALQRSLTFARNFPGAFSLPIIFLLVEFYDEFVYALGGAALPVMRADLGLTYAQVGLLIGLPGIINTCIEPVLMLLGDTSLRKRLVVAGGVGMAVAALLIGGAQSFWLLLAAEVLSYPSSGAFVTLSQATLMDLHPGREAQWMARWTVSGSLANLIAPMVLAGGFALSLGWRWNYVLMALAGLAMAAWMAFQPFPRRQTPPPAGEVQQPRRGGMMAELALNLWQAIRNRRLMRWVILLQFSDLLLDMFTGYAALYFADVVGFDAIQTSLVMGLFMLANLISDVALIPLLEKFDGRTIVRVSAGCAAVLYPAFLLAPWPVAKIVLALLVRAATLGWYPVMEGESFATVPGRSGTVKAIGSLMGLVAGASAGFVGWFAGLAGLQTAMWLLVAGPLVLVCFVPNREQGSKTVG